MYLNNNKKLSQNPSHNNKNNSIFSFKRTQNEENNSNIQYPQQAININSENNQELGLIREVKRRDEFQEN